MKRTRPKLSSEQLFNLAWAAGVVVYIVVMYLHFHRCVDHTYSERSLTDLLHFAPVALVTCRKGIRREYRLMTRKVRLFIIVYQFLKLQNNY